jgi:hypothetical protein
MTSGARPADSIRPDEPELLASNTVFCTILCRHTARVEHGEIDMDFIVGEWRDVVYGMELEDTQEAFSYYACSCGCGCTHSYTDPTSSYCRGCRNGLCPEDD